MGEIVELSSELAAAAAANDLERVALMLERRNRTLAGADPNAVAEAIEKGEQARVSLAARKETLREQIATLRKARHAARRPRERRGTSLDVSL